MPKHLTPRLKREAVAEYERLCHDELRTVAAGIVAERFGCSASTIQKAAAEAAKVTQCISMDTSDVYRPFNMSPVKAANVELSKETTVEAFISDVHWHPEAAHGHDPAAWAITALALKELQPDIVFLGGDIVDCYAPSRYEKIPRLATPEAFNGEIHYAKERLTELRETVPNARIIWLTGNHELRLPRSIQSNAPWLYDAFQSVESRLDLSQYDAELVEDGYQIGKLRHYHGHENAGAGRVNIAKAKFERLLCNAIFGHHHRFSKWIQRNADGGYWGAFGNGCLQWLSVDFAKNTEWHQGFTIIEYSRGGNFHVDQVLIVKPEIFSHKAELIYQGRHLKVDMERSQGYANAAK